MWCKGMDLESLFGGRYLGLDMAGKCEAMEKYKLKSDQFTCRGWLRRLLVEAYVQAHEVYVGAEQIHYLCFGAALGYSTKAFMVFT